jgi:hypothetical protein
MLLNRWNSDSGLSWMLFFVTLGMNSRMISSNFSYGCRPVMDVFISLSIENNIVGKVVTFSFLA